MNSSDWGLWSGDRAPNLLPKITDGPPMKIIDRPPDQAKRSVDLLTAYSKRPDLAVDLQKLGDQLVAAAREPTRRQSVQSTGRLGGPERLEDRLSPADIEHLVSAFLSGTPKWKLAEQYSMTMSGIKDLLRRQGVRKRHKYDHS